MTTLSTALATFAPFNSLTPQPAAAPNPPALISAHLLGTYSTEQLQSRYRGSASMLRFLTKHGIQVYRLTYHTAGADGKPVVASGAVLLPDTNLPVPLLSIQHGTLRSETQAPSHYNSNSEVYTFGSVFASTGYIVAAPDYVGYGASKALPHPYQHNRTLASASLDMLRATREFLADRKTNWNKELYIAGYSEGGYATMALQRALEENVPREFRLVAASAGAGAYDKPAFMRHLLTTRTHGNPDYNRLYLWVLLTYDRVYGLNRPASYYFREPYASRVEASGRGAVLDVSFNETLTDSFRKAIADGTDKAFITAIGDNDIHDWKPTTPTRLYHGDADDTVFYFNTQNAYDAMRQRGATNVTLYKLPGRNHYAGITDFVLGTFEFFNSRQAQ